MICLYHSRDLDGWASAAIVKYWWNGLPDNFKLANKNLKLIGWDYGQEIPKEAFDGQYVIMVDISFPQKDMLEICKTASEFVWIDHHTSAIKSMDNAFFETHKVSPPSGLRNTQLAACELTWMNFFNIAIPPAIEFLGMYDSFRHKNTNNETEVIKFQYAARSIASSPEEAAVFVGMTKSETYMLAQKGKAILNYLEKEAKNSYKKPYKVVANASGKFIVFNKGRFNPVNFGIDYHADGYDGVICFIGENLNFSFSIYNDNGKVNCAEIAKKYKGGGHVGAAGWVQNDTGLPDFRIIKF